MRHTFGFLPLVVLALAGCPTRNTPTLDVGPAGMDAPGTDAPGSCATGAENTVAACTDGCSNDGDTFVDCQEGDCCGVVPCGVGTFCGDRADAGPRPGACDGAVVAEDNAAACSDGCDNDGDGFADCNDFGCCSSVSCTTGACARDGGPGPVGACDGGVGAEDNAAACSDGCDNDDDGFADCNDFGCCSSVACTTGACARDGGPGPGRACDGGIGAEDTVAACSDGCDNDDNGFFDCGDFDCCSVVTCGPTTPCGRRDGGTCALGRESTALACADGCSNDGDTYVDCEDRDCCGVVSCAAGTYCGDLTDAGPRPDGGPRLGGCDGGTALENTAAACGNGCDDDGDGYADCDDYGCCGVVTCGPSTSCGRRDGGGCVAGRENTVAACTDGCSNDGDFFVDCEERDCCGVVTCGPTTFCGMPDAGAP